MKTTSNQFHVLQLLEEGEERHFEKIQKTMERAKGNNNNSCCMYYIGKENFAIRSGQKINLLSFRIFLKSKDSYIMIDKNSNFKDLWVFIDLKRQWCYVMTEGELIDIDFLCVLEAEQSESKKFTNGFYCNKDRCTLIYDADCANALFDLINNYNNAIALKKNGIQTSFDEKEDCSVRF